MDVIFEPTQQHHLRYLPKEALPRLCEDTKGVTAIDPKRGPVAISLIDTWTENSCQIHMWIGNRMVLRHGFLEEVFGFIFGEDSGRNMTIGAFSSDNDKMLAFSKHVGFKEIARIPDAVEVGVDSVLTVMTKQDCRWIEHGHF